MKTKEVLEILKVVTWIIFIGLCIETGAMLVSFFVSLFINSGGAKNLYMGLNLSELYYYSKWHYVTLASLTIIISGLKAWLFYWVIKVISKINFTNPFSEIIAAIISRIANISLQIGITALLTNIYTEWLQDTVSFSYERSESQFLFLAGVLLVIAQIFKRGIELQSENELTI